MSRADDEGDAPHRPEDAQTDVCVLCDRPFGFGEGVVTDKVAACHRCMAE